MEAPTTITTRRRERSMTKEEISSLLTPVVFGFFERQYMTDLEPSSYKALEPETEALFVALANFIDINPTINRISASFRALGRYEYWKTRGIEGYVDGPISKAIPVILEMAKQFEMGQAFMKAPHFPV
jgi:hypothetical protein